MAKRKIQQARMRAARQGVRREWPVGERHWNAVLSDHEAELLIALRLEGWSWRWLSEKFEVSVRCCRDIFHGRRRAAVTGRGW